MAGTLLFVIVFLASLGAAVFAWVQWFSLGERFQPPKWRSFLAVAGLSAATLEIVVLVLFEAYALIVGSFSYRARTIFIWGRVASYLCVIALLAAVLGKGRIRIPVALSAVATEAIWFALAMAL
ncbi:MAG TPA: hypothetical protein VGZ29_04225 [Terriglobia bacterium]|nr:hypothetical protein [Terriglobia bacterium]